jgi:AbrB family looped-hinge helix DNA binding protein
MIKNVDELGRMVLPKVWRDEMGIDKNTQLRLSYNGKQITIEIDYLTSEEIEKQIKDLQFVLELRRNKHE